jgi:predicted signal transduction protein with EAL and GGDEF domain
MKNADVAMYRAKERGRNAYEFFTKELTQSSLARLQMETDLRRAIERDELRVYLQPQFSLKTGQDSSAPRRWYAGCARARTGDAGRIHQTGRGIRTDCPDR